MLDIRPMRREDLDEVLSLERACFPHPWSRGMLEEELRRSNGVFLVAREASELLGYAGILFIMEEGHVTNLAVREDRRRGGVASALLLESISRAMREGIRFLTLEVRRSNSPALRLYRRFGFSVIGERRGYYMDNGEDALIMWTEDITAPEYGELLDGISRELRAAVEGGTA